MQLNIRHILFTFVLAGLLGLGCEATVSVPSEPPHPADLVPSTSGKADGETFDRHNLLSDALFRDGNYMTVDEIQEFLEETPYQNRSGLAGETFHGETAAEIILDAARRYSVNPLLLLTKLQVEFSLVYKENPSAFSLNYAMGCGCDDETVACEVAVSGFRQQVLCGAELLERHFLVAERGDATISGWKVGRTKKTSDDISVTPENASTVSLYTYTPWVLTGEGGNWLLWNVYHKFSEHFGKQRPNHHWIGGTCENDETCAYDEGFCFKKWNVTRVCTKPCSLYCPDTDAPFSAETFCVDLGQNGWLSSEDTGHCLSRCDVDLFSENDGCEEGFTCVESPRFSQPETVRTVCWPDGLTPPETASTE